MLNFALSKTTRNIHWPYGDSKDEFSNLEYLAKFKLESRYASNTLELNNPCTVV